MKPNSTRQHHFHTQEVDEESTNENQIVYIAETIKERIGHED
jgi:hypothetical protein